MSLIESARAFGFNLKKNRLLNVLFFPLSIFCYVLNLLPHGRSNRILVANMGGIGDILMMSPMAVKLSKRYKVDLIVQSPNTKKAFIGQDYFSDIFVIQNYKIDRFRLPEKKLLSTLLLLLFYPLEYLRFSARRYRMGFNCAHFPNNSNFTNVLFKALNIPRKYGFTDKVGIYLDAVVRHEGIYGAGLYLALLKPAGVKTTPSHELYYRVDRSRAEQAFKEMVAPSLGQGFDKIALFHPGGKIHINSRRWPKEYFAEVGRFLVSRGFVVLVSGDDGDRDVCAYVADAIGPKALNVCGRLDFQDFAALLSKADLCVTNDTSTVHLANAVRCPKILSIFGPTSSEFFVPDNGRNVIIKSGLECSPCRGTFLHEEVVPCPRSVKLECLKTITPETVIKKIVQAVGMSEKPAV